MPKPTLPVPKAEPADLARAKAIEPEQAEVLAGAATVAEAANRTALQAELALRSARLDRDLAAFAGTATQAHDDAILAAQQAYEDAVLDLRIAQRDVSHLVDAVGQQYGVTDPRNRVDAKTGALRR